MSFCSCASACCSAASKGRLSSVNRTWPCWTSSPSLKLTSVSSPVICARTATVDAAMTVPIACTSSGTDFCATAVAVTGTGGFWPPPRPPADAVLETASPPDQAAVETATSAATIHWTDVRTSLLLESQRVDRVERGRFSCRIKTEEHARHRREPERDDHGLGRDRGGPGHP